jgi:uncharacterized SAM-binding protein YcdF (DUF218 family)
MIFGVSIGIVVILIVALLITSEFNSTVNESDNTDFAIILGAGLNGDQVSDRLKLRLDTAFDFLKNSDMPIIVSGGQGADELISEAQAMKQYLIEKGITSDRIILEDQSTSTYENLVFSKEIMTIENANVILVTSDYHMYQAKRIGKRVGFDIQGISAINSTGERIVRMRREILAVIKDIIVR